MNEHPYMYGFRAMVMENGKKVGIMGGECPASVILIKPVYSVQEVLNNAGHTNLDVRDAWLITDDLETSPAPIVS